MTMMMVVVDASEAHIAAKFCPTIVCNAEVEAEAETCKTGIAPEGGTEEQDLGTNKENITEKKARCATPPFPFAQPARKSSSSSNSEAWYLDGDGSQKAVSQYPLTYINWEQNDLMPDGGGVEYGEGELDFEAFDFFNFDLHPTSLYPHAPLSRPSSSLGVVFTIATPSITSTPSLPRLLQSDKPAQPNKEMIKFLGIRCQDEGPSPTQANASRERVSLITHTHTTLEPTESEHKFKPLKLETPSKSEKLEDLTNPREAGLRELGMYEAALARRRDVLETGLRGVRSSGSAWAPSTAARCLCPELGMGEVFVMVRVGVEFLESSSSLHVFLRLELELWIFEQDLSIRYHLFNKTSSQPQRV
ncbi:hypothetical protein EV361DRAFT_977038 [Lentinula raphanica]|nr:hypothetical protein EV361DRAFT_977038 [Lentinula raphanica]